MLTDNVFQTIHMIYLGRKNWLSSATLRTNQYRSLPINLRVLDELPPSEIFCLITVPLAKLSFNDRLLKDSLAVRGTDISIRVERHDVHTRYHWAVVASDLYNFIYIFKESDVLFIPCCYDVYIRRNVPLMAGSITWHV